MTTAVAVKQTAEDLILAADGQPRTIAQWCELVDRKYSTVRLTLNRLVEEDKLVKSEENGVVYFGVTYTSLTALFDDHKNDDLLYIDEEPPFTPAPTPIRYNLTIDEEGDSVLTFVLDGSVRTVDVGHPAFARIADALAKGEDPTPFFAETAYEDVDERIEVVEEDDGPVVKFDGLPVHSHLLDAFARYQSDGRDVSNIVKFLERLAKNPSERAREELFNWTQATHLTIDEEGFFVGYKAVNRSDRHGRFIVDGFEDADDSVDLLEGVPYCSTHAGPATVNGVRGHGFVPNDVGYVIEMDRDICDPDSHTDCSVGLHVGSWSYARGFAQVVTEVKVDPADVVSVPHYDTNKLRCCRYEVLAIHDSKLDDIADRYEPPATWSTQEFVDTVAGAGVPKGFVKKLRARLGRRHRIEAEVDEF